MQLGLDALAHCRKIRSEERAGSASESIHGAVRTDRTNRTDTPGVSRMMEERSSVTDAFRPSRRWVRFPNRRITTRPRRKTLWARLLRAVAGGDRVDRPGGAGCHLVSGGSQGRASIRADRRNGCGTDQGLCVQRPRRPGAHRGGMEGLPERSCSSQSRRTAPSRATMRRRWLDWPGSSDREGSRSSASIREAGASAESSRWRATGWDLPFPILLDPAQLVARQADVRVTPEAVVVLPDGQVIYRGRIDDRYAADGRKRPQPRTARPGGRARGHPGGRDAGRHGRGRVWKPAGLRTPRATIPAGRSRSPSTSRRSSGRTAPGAIAPVRSGRSHC